MRFNGHLIEYSSDQGSARVGCKGLREEWICSFNIGQRIIISALGGCEKLYSGVWRFESVYTYVSDRYRNKNGRRYKERKTMSSCNHDVENERRTMRIS